MKRLLMTIGLTCTLSVSALGGEIPSVPGPPPPSDDVTTFLITQSQGGDVPSVDYSESGSMLDLIKLMAVLMF